MEKEYKSSLLLVLLGIIKVAVLPVFLTMALAISIYGEGNIAAIAIVSVLFGLGVAAVIVLPLHNIKVTVTDEAVSFKRRGREYKRFTFSENDFTSHVDVHSWYFIPILTSRKLRVIPKDSDKYKDYTCHNFSQKTFEECMAYVDSRGFRQNLSKPVEDEQGEGFRQAVSALEAEPLVFTINKEAFINKYKNLFKILIITMGIITALLFFITFIIPAINGDSAALQNAGGMLIFLTVVAGILMSLPFILALRPLSKVRNTAPEKVTLYPDRVVFDEKIVHFKDIQQIKMTPPAYSKDSGTIRVLKVIDNSGITEYALGHYSDVTQISKKKPKIFEEYEDFYHALGNVSALWAEQNNEQSRFTPELW
ncbi:MAG: hypothetical protein FWD34_06100 [Oscillospiraceae bacterium]|nr:hypothetical protein [Oscillospiraceae bacterium]